MSHNSSPLKGLSNHSAAIRETMPGSDRHCIRVAMWRSVSGCRNVAKYLRLGSLSSRMLQRCLVVEMQMTESPMTEKKPRLRCDEAFAFNPTIAYVNNEFCVCVSRIRGSSIPLSLAKFSP